MSSPIPHADALQLALTCTPRSPNSKYCALTIHKYFPAPLKTLHVLERRLLLQQAMTGLHQKMVLVCLLTCLPCLPSKPRLQL